MEKEKLQLVRSGNYARQKAYNKQDIYYFGACQSNKVDKHYSSQLVIQDKIDKDYNCFQCIDDKDLKNRTGFHYFDKGEDKNVKLLYTLYNIWGQQKESLLLTFDFISSSLTIDDLNGNCKTIKIKEDKQREYTYKVLKTCIKSIDGLNGLFKFIVECMHIDSPFDSYMYNQLKTLI